MKDFISSRLSRRQLLKFLGILSAYCSFNQLVTRKSDAATISKVYIAKNGDCFQCTSKIWEMLGGASRYISPTDIVVIKANGQWPNQGYTHTGVIKGIIDGILNIPGYSGEVLICDNVQSNGASGQFGFDALPEFRVNNWPDHNWNSLADLYQSQGKPVAVKRWYNSSRDMPETYLTETANPASGEEWVRCTFSFHGNNSYFSYPVFASPLNANRIIDLKNGVWENGAYTGQKVKVIVMPGLNNHGYGSEDYAGVTSAIKSFFGMTEIHYDQDFIFQGYKNVHGSSYSASSSEGATYAGELCARYIQTMVKPILYITAAIWSGHHSRTGAAVQTNTVLACDNPATLDYIACKHVISPYASFLNPDRENNTRKQIIGCINAGIGTINSSEIQVISYDFQNNPPPAPKNLRVA